MRNWMPHNRYVRAASAWTGFYMALLLLQLSGLHGLWRYLVPGIFAAAFVLAMLMSMRLCERYIDAAAHAGSAGLTIQRVCTGLLIMACIAGPLLHWFLIG